LTSFPNKFSKPKKDGFEAYKQTGKLNLDLYMDILKSNPKIVE
jgi:hypothetical protein